MNDTASRDIVIKAENDLEVQQMQTENNLLRVENDRLSELANLFKSKHEATEQQLGLTTRRCHDLQKTCVEFERRLGNINKTGLKRAPPADKFAQLKDQLALQVEENRALKASFRAGLATKDEEIRILRKLSEESQQAYEVAIAETKRQVKQTASLSQAKAIHHESRQEIAMLTQLKQDNEFLRTELAEMKSKHQSYVAKTQNRKK